MVSDVCRQLLEREEVTREDQVDMHHCLDQIRHQASAVEGAAKG
jgi:hypothetical protein